MATQIVAAVVAGALTGTCTAAIAHSMYPTLRVLYRKGPGGPDYDMNGKLTEYTTLIGGPPYWDIRPGYLFFTTAGAVVALVVVATYLLGTWLARRPGRAGRQRALRHR